MTVCLSFCILFANSCIYDFHIVNYEYKVRVLQNAIRIVRRGLLKLI